MTDQERADLLQRLTDERMTIELLTRYGSGREALEAARKRYDETRDRILALMKAGEDG